MKLRWGICTAGLIANDFTLALSLLPADQHEVVAVAARSESDAARFAEKHGIATAYGGYEALARDANVDIVYIGARSHLHCPLCKFFLGHGKNVLCETPLGINKREIQEIIHLAKQKNVFVMEGMWTRFFPVYAKLRTLLDEGRIGDVKSVIGSLGIHLADGRLRNKEEGGGGILEVSTFLVHATLMTFNQAPLSWSTKGFLGSTGVDETTVTTILFPDNAMATLTSSIEAHLPNEIVIGGTKGYITISPMFWCPVKMEVTTIVAKSENVVNFEEKREVMEFPFPSNKDGFNYPNGAGFQYEAEAVRQCIIKGLTECPTVSHNDSLLVHEILQDARHDVGYLLDVDKQQVTTMPCQ